MNIQTIPPVVKKVREVVIRHRKGIRHYIKWGLIHTAMVLFFADFVAVF